MKPACGPWPAKDTCGCPLRRDSGHVRKTSAMQPIAKEGVTRGSKAGIVIRMVSHQDGGTGGLRQWDGSLFADVWVGMTSVLVGPSASKRACTTATGPPLTHPME